VRLVADLDQLRGHPHPFAGLADAPFQDVVHTKLFADCRNGLGRRFVLHRRRACDHAKSIWPQPTKSRNDLLVQPVDEVLPLPTRASTYGIVVHFGEGNATSVTPARCSSAENRESLRSSSSIGSTLK
jgi:hypothetical protein